MSDENPSFVWLVCPKCRSRRHVPREQLNQRILCRQCSTALVAGPEEQATEQPASSEPTVPDLDVADDELQPEAPVERIEIFKEALANPPPPEPRHDDWVMPAIGKSLSWAFFSGVFTYAWWPNAVGKWIFLSVVSSVSGLLLSIVPSAIAAGGPMGGAAGGLFGIGGLLIGMFALSYGAACFVDIIVNTAYNTDKAADWPDIDWRERLIIFVRMIYLLTLAVVPAAAIAKILSVTPLGVGRFGAIFVSGTFLLFPIMLLSSMEADSIWPLSLPTWRSLKTAWPGWAVFYSAAALLIMAVLAINAIAIAALGVLAPLIACPISAAALFSYARLLGRLAWFIRRAESDDPRLNEGFAYLDDESEDQAGGA